MVFQDVNHQLFSESVSEDVTLGLRLSEDEKRSTAEEMLRRMELWGYREAHPMALSGGQKQRLAIAGGTKGYYLIRRTHQRSRLPQHGAHGREYPAPL